MADNEKHADLDADAQPSGPGLMSRLKVLGAVLGIVLVECVLAQLLLPSHSEIEAMERERVGTEQQQPPEDKPLQDGDTVVEVDIGEFTVAESLPGSNSTVRIDFTLAGTVLAEDVEQFNARKNRNIKRLREQVVIAIRAAEVSDLTDARLALIKRQILEKTNRALGKPLLRSVVIPEFSFVEQ